jgi:hypothetical protein
LRGQLLDQPMNGWTVGSETRDHGRKVQAPGQLSGACLAAPAAKGTGAQPGESRDGAASWR